jgi:hypothetical protein
MSAATKPLAGDKKLLFSLTGIILVLIVLISVLSPRPDEDASPSTYNASPRGLKGIYLTLQKLGREPVRWTRPLSELDPAQAAHTTLILADPDFNPQDRQQFADQIETFLRHGGRVLATDTTGAQLLPHGLTKAHGTLQNELCITTPEGSGPLARAGHVEITERSQWAAEGPLFRTEQRCGNDPVVVRYAIPDAAGAGQGEAIWWTSATPMDNSELKNDPDLRLFLASIDDDPGHPRTILFDETLHGVTASLWDAAKGLPLRWIALQSALLFVLLILSFSRRRGPVRMPVLLPRSSPVEFAASMGDLYEKAHATAAATEAARRRLLQLLSREAGLNHSTLAAGPEAIAEELEARLGGDWRQLAAHLHAADAVSTSTTPRTALALVRALSEDAESLRNALHRNLQPLGS